MRSLPKPILRNVVMQDLPHALARPRKAVAAVGEPHGAKVPLATPAPAATKLAPAPTYDDGFAEGYQKGLDAGLRQQRAETEARDRAAAEQAVARACDEARAAGLLRGQQEAAAAARDQQERWIAESKSALDGRLQRLDALARQLEGQFDVAQRAAHDELVALAFEAVCRVLGHRAVEPEVIRDMAQYLAQQRRERGVFSLHVHPADLEILRQAGFAAAAEGASWAADDSVQLGGIVLRSKDGDIDARLEVQLQSLRDLLLRVRAELSVAARENEAAA